MSTARPSSRSSRGSSSSSLESQQQQRNSESDSQPLHLPTLNSRPPKKKILEIVHYVAPQWYELGIQLLNEDQERHLDLIKVDSGSNSKDCCIKMFWYWLESHPEATWQDLLNSLRSPALELHNTAANIEGLLGNQYKQQEIYEQVKQEQEDIPNFEFDSITEAFLYLTSNISELLQKENFRTIRRACVEQINTPKGAQLSPDMKHRVQTANDLDALLDTLADSPYWSWIDLRLLKAIIAVASNSRQTCRKLVNAYENQIFSKKLIEVISSIPRKEVTDEIYGKMVSKFGKNLEEITINDLLKLKSELETVIMNLKSGTCALACIVEGCIEIHWFLPNDYVDHVYNAASLKRHTFYTLHLQYLQVGTYEKIYDPAILYSSHLAAVELPLPADAASSKDIIDYFNHYLTAEMDSGLIVKHMLSQQMLNDHEFHIIMSGMGDYQRNCLLLEKIRLMNTDSLVSFCKILHMFDCQKHIANVLLNALEHFKSEPIRIEMDTATTVHQKTMFATDTMTYSTTGRSRKELTLSEQLASQKHFKPSIVTLSEQSTSQKHFKPSSVNSAFLDMKVQLECMMQSSNSLKIYEQCKTLMASNDYNIALFTNKFLDTIKECQFAQQILQKLSPWFNWSSHSLLSVVVEACNNSEAAVLLQRFDAQVDLTLPIAEYPIPQPIPSMAPHDTSTQTVLAVKLNTKLKELSLQQAIEVRCLIQKNFHITEHSLQLMATKSCQNILYWMIPKCVFHLISSKIIQDVSVSGIRVEEISVYPDTLYVSVSGLKLGTLTFLTQINHSLSKNENEVLSNQLSNLKELPDMMSKLQSDFYYNEPSTESENEIFSSETSRLASSHDMKAVLKHVNAQNVELRTQLMESKKFENALQQQNSKAEEKYSDLYQMYENLKMLSNGEEMEAQLSSLKSKMLDVKAEFGCIDVIKIQCIEEHSDEISIEKLNELSSGVGQLQILNKELQTLEKWSKLLQEEFMHNKEEINTLQKQSKLLQEESMHNKEEINTLQKRSKLLQEESMQNKEEINTLQKQSKLLQEESMHNKEEINTLQKRSKLLQEESMHNEEEINTLQDKNKMLQNKMLENQSELMIKDRELSKLKEDNKLLAKQFREKKESQKKRQQFFSQEQLRKQELLGSGQFGSVNKITYLKELFAGKSIHPKHIPGYPNSSAAQLKQFEKEFQEKSALYSYFDHNNIEQVETAITLASESLPILLSELLPENLDMFTTRMKGSLPVYQQLDLCSDMANGLHYLHDSGLAHTNLHGRNVLVSHDGHAKIGDYVCPQVIRLSEELPSHNIPYLPPEAIEDKSQWTEQSDIYSLGVLFLQVATQDIPKPTDKTELSKLKQRREELASIGNHHPLVSIIQRCLTTIKVARPSASQVLEQTKRSKESPQSVISSSLNNKESPEFGLSLQSGKYKLQWTGCSNLPTAMYGALATVINTTLYICGGCCPNDSMGKHNVYKYELNDDHWSILPRLQHYFGIPVNINNQITIIGGKHSTTKKPTKLVTTYNGNSWNNTYPNLSVARSEPAAVLYSHYVIVAGGESDNNTLLDSIEVFDIPKSQWVIVNTCLPEPMYNVSATICADTFTIVGYTYEGDDRSNSTWIVPVYEIVPQQQQLPTSSTEKENAKWDKLANAAYWFTTLVPNSSPPTVVGGSNEENNTVNDIAVYDDITKSWKKLESLPMNCCFATVAVINQSIIVMGGSSDVDTQEKCNATALSDVYIGQLALLDE